MKRILKEQEEYEEQGTSFGIPGKKQNLPKWITEIDNFDKCIVHATYNLYSQEETVPAVTKLLVKLKESIGFKGKCSCLREIIRKLITLVLFLGKSAVNVKIIFWKLPTDAFGRET